MDTPSTPQQEISTETTPAQESSQVTSETTQSTPNGEATGSMATPKPESWEYNGDRKAVPDNFRKYVEGLDRYVSKKDQAASEVRKKAEEYEQFVNSDNYKSYKEFIAQNPRSGVPTDKPQAPIVTQEEAEAIAVGDTNTLMKVIQREVQRNIEATVSPKEAELKQGLNALTMKQRQVENAQMIQSFAEVHPDFWELYDTYEDYAVNAVRNGKSLEDVYKSLQFFEDKSSQRFESKRKADVDKKKAGTVVGKSIPGTPDVVLQRTKIKPKDWLSN